MLIETEIIFTDESQSNLLGKDVSKIDTFIFDLEHVSAIMPGTSDKKCSIIFLDGKDLIINTPFAALLKIFKKCKGVDNAEYFSCEDKNK